MSPFALVLAAVAAFALPGAYPAARTLPATAVSHPVAGMPTAAAAAGRADAPAFTAADRTARLSCRAVSGEPLRPLVELYTSEGCDSCPPADRWLSAHVAHATDGPIAVAFHVDYWDRLGWKDRFASSDYTARQHRAAEANGAAFVYTPQVLLQGRDFAWRSGDATRTLEAAAAGAPGARIEAEATRASDGIAVTARAHVASPGGAPLVLMLAYVDSGLVSQVTAGENRGARLAHDRVVRALASGEAGRQDLVARAHLPLPAERGRDPSLVAFVQRPSDGAVLQALDVPLAACVP